MKFTQREYELMRLLIKGLNNKEIAEQMNISAHTVKFYLKHIFFKTDKKNRYELAYYLGKNNIL